MDQNTSTRVGNDGEESSRRERLRALIHSARSQASNAVRVASATAGFSGGAGPSSAGGGVGADSTGRMLTACLPGYEILREVHRGGQGLVFEAFQSSTRRRVAIKVMREGPFASTADLARFEREVQILAQLHHPCIVAIHDSGRAAEHFYYVMDFIVGRPLDEYARECCGRGDEPDAGTQQSGRRRRPDVNAILGLFVQTCDAVNAAHLRGVIHRDVKPGNILVDAAGVPHVLDFGLAKTTVALSDDGQRVHGEPNAPAGGRETTMAGQFLGSLPWASPEQVAGEVGGLDIRTDVYSLGVMLYQALTGRFPYDVLGSLGEVMSRITRVEPVRPRLIRNDIDDEVETIVLKCLQKDPSRRYQSAGEMGRDLRRYLAGEAVEAKTDSAWYVLRKAVRRYRTPVAVLGLFLMLLAGSTIVAVFLAADAREAQSATAAAERRAVGSLRESLIAQARAVRRSGWTGQRSDALAALKKAAEIDPTLEVRNEAIAALAQVDLGPARRIERQGIGYFDPELLHCAVVHADGAMTIIRLEDDAELARIPATSSGRVQIHGVALRMPYLVRTFDPTEGDRRLEVWRLPAGEMVLELTDVPVRSRFDVSPDGRQLAVGRLDQAIHIYDLQTMQPVQRIALDRQPSYVSFDPTGRRLALYHDRFAAAELLELDTGARTPIFESRDIGWAMAWDPGGRWVAAPASNNIELWDVAARRCIALLAAHEDQIVHLAASHDGSLLLSYSWDGYSVLWDVRTRRPLLRMALTRPVFSADDTLVGATTVEGTNEVIEVRRLGGHAPRRRLASWGDVESLVIPVGAFEPRTGLLCMVETRSPEESFLRVYDPGSGNELVRHALNSAGALALDPAGRFLISSRSDGLLRWPLRVEPGRLTIGPPAVIPGPAAAETAALSADGTVVVSGMTGSGRFDVADLNGGSVRTVGAGQRAAAVRISPDGRWIAIAHWYGATAEVWDAKSGLQVATLSVTGNPGIEFTPDGAALVTSDSERIAVWEAGTWLLMRESPQKAWIRGFSPDGRLLAAFPDMTRIRLLDFDTLEEVATLEPSESFYSRSCAFSADGTMLAQFTNRSGVVQLWDLRQLRKELAAMGLDWDRPPYPPVPDAPSVTWEVTLNPGDTAAP